MDQRFILYSIPRIQSALSRGGGDDEDFDLNMLPFEVFPGLSIEDVSGQIAEGEFESYQSSIGRFDFEKLQYLRYALVFRYPESRYEWNPVAEIGFRAEEEARKIIGYAVACLRLIRPMRQQLHSFNGRIRESDGKFTNIGFDSPQHAESTPLNQRLFGLRTQDALRLRELYRPFQAAFKAENYKFRMAVHLHESGCQQEEWRAKFLIWTTAIEALFTTQSAEHIGSKVAKARILDLLGHTTEIYAKGELDSVYHQRTTTVADVLDDLYCLRNHIAHGDRIPTYYTDSVVDIGPYETRATRADGLLEAASFIVRSSLLKILDENLVPHFADEIASQAYFTAKNLTKSAIPKRTIICPT